MKKKLAGKYFFEWLGRSDFRNGKKRRDWVGNFMRFTCAYHHGYSFEQIYGGEPK